jgi:hypothetical protein
MAELVYSVNQIIVSIHNDLRIRDTYPGSRIQEPIIFHPGSTVDKIPKPESESASKN